MTNDLVILNRAKSAAALIHDSKLRAEVTDVIGEGEDNTRDTCAERPELLENFEERSRVTIESICMRLTSSEPPSSAAIAWFECYGIRG